MSERKSVWVHAKDVETPDWHKLVEVLTFRRTYDNTYCLWGNTTSASRLHALLKEDKDVKRYAMSAWFETSRRCESCEQDYQTVEQGDLIANCPRCCQRMVYKDLYNQIESWKTSAYGWKNWAERLVGDRELEPGGRSVDERLRYTIEAMLPESDE